MPNKNLNGGGGLGGGSMGGGGGYVRTPSDPVRLTTRGKVVTGGVVGAGLAGTAWSVGKMVHSADKSRQAAYDKYLKGYQGSAEQRSGMTQNDYVQMQMEKRNNGK